jgi:hypothetical protein
MVVAWMTMHCTAIPSVEERSWECASATFNGQIHNVYRESGLLSRTRNYTGILSLYDAAAMLTRLRKR